MGRDLHVGEVDAVEVAEHLVDLRGVLQDGACCLGQVVQRRVSAQGLSKGTNSGYLSKTEETKTYVRSERTSHNMLVIIKCFCLATAAQFLIHRNI